MPTPASMVASWALMEVASRCSIALSSSAIEEGDEDEDEEEEELLEAAEALAGAGRLPRAASDDAGGCCHAPPLPRPPGEPCERSAMTDESERKANKVTQPPARDGKGVVSAQV